MSYLINNSRGQIIAVIPDGTTDTSSTSLALVGRGVTGYGTAENENYVYLLENFANSTAPLQPILGQLWYNSSTDVISSYSSANSWVALASQTYVQAQKISPVFTGTPLAPTAANGTANTQIATTGFVQAALNGSGTGTTAISANVAVSGTLTASAVTITGTSSAFRLPNLSQAQINTLTPQNGDMVFNTTLGLTQLYQGGSWGNVSAV